MLAHLLSDISVAEGLLFLGLLSVGTLLWTLGYWAGTNH